jgi:hypothetical protein
LIILHKQVSVTGSICASNDNNLKE